MSFEPGVTFNFRDPDYRPVFRRRLELLEKLRADPGMLAAFKVHYRYNPADFINDWGVTFDPRLIERELPAVMPFVLFPRQRECIEYIVRKWREGKPGLIEKSRDVGLSWIAVGLGCTLCVFNDSFVVGYGSRKEEYVDKLDSPKALFYKARMFMKYLPPEFRAGWQEKKHAPHMRLMFPDTGSVMTGEAGDGIGRGDRTSLYLVDEAAFLERPMLIEASLSATTNCRIDLSSVNGMDNPFAQKRHAGKIEVFVFDWRDDPRKDDAWYAKQVEEAADPVIVAQEIDRNYTASKEGIVIPNAWVQSSIDAHVKLGIQPTGALSGALDIADEGRDLNSFGSRHGVVLRTLEKWAGIGSDIFGTVAKAFGICDVFGLRSFLYDSDGLGAGARGDARVLNEQRKEADRKPIDAEPFRGSGSVIDPDGPIPSATRKKGDKDERTNKDFFANRKAQAWWALRVRFQITHRAVTEGAEFDPDEIISLSSDLSELAALTVELSQPTYSINGAGKILIDKAPDGSRSPNLADTVMMLYSPQERKRRGFLT
jgi:phage terminase large subunit